MSKQKQKAPVMPLMVRDAIVDTGHLPSDVFKGYWLLTLKSWLGVERAEPGYLPSDETKLQEMSGLDRAAWRKSKDRVLDLFHLGEDGRRYSKRNVAELERLAEVSASKAESGRYGGVKSGESRRKQTLPVASSEGKQTLRLNEANDQAKRSSASASASALASAVPEVEGSGNGESLPTPPPDQEGARPAAPAKLQVSERMTEASAEAAFGQLASEYPPEAIQSLFAAQREWAVALPFLPPLAEMLAALKRQKASDQWRRGKVPDLARWIRERMWTGGVGATPARGANPDDDQLETWARGGA